MVTSRASLSRRLGKHIESTHLQSSSSKLAQSLRLTTAATGTQRQGSLICSSPK